MDLPRSPTGVPYMPDGYQPGGQPAQPWPGWARVALFVACYLGLQGLYAYGGGTAVERFFLVDSGSRPAAWLINLLQPGIGARAVDARIVAPGGGIGIANGCEGTDIYFLLVAAFAAAALPWRRRAAGLLLGVALAFVLNQARIIALFHAFRNDRSLFELLHTTILPVLLVAAVGLYFHACLRRARPRRHPDA